MYSIKHLRLLCTLYVHITIQHNNPVKTYELLRINQVLQYVQVYVFHIDVNMPNSAKFLEWTYPFFLTEQQTLYT